MIPLPPSLLVIEIPSTFQPSTRGWPRNCPRNYPESLFHRMRNNNRGHQRNRHRYRSFRIVGSSPPSPCESKRYTKISSRGWARGTISSDSLLIMKERKKREGLEILTLADIEPGTRIFQN